MEGCVQYTAKFYINMDGTGILDIAYVVNKSVLKAVVEQRMGRFNFLPLSEKGVRDYYKKKKDIKLIDVKFKSLDPTTERIHIMVSFKNVKNLDDNQMRYSWNLENGRYTFRIVLKPAGTLVHRAKNNPMIEKAIREAMSKYFMTFEAHLPRKIVETNADEVDWNVATWKITLYNMTHMRHEKILYASVKTRWYEIIWWWVKFIWHRIISIF